MVALIAQGGHLVRDNLHVVCIGIVAVVLMLLGPACMRFVLDRISKLHWLLRYLIVILLITAVYGAASNLLYWWLKHFLSSMKNASLFFVTIGIYLGLGLLAKSKKKI